MTAEKLLAAYPGARVAVAYTELILCGPGDEDDPESSWDMMMRACPPLTPDEVLDLVRLALDGETTCRATEALAETYHQDYRRYLAGKMGMVCVEKTAGGPLAYTCPECGATLKRVLTNVGDSQTDHCCLDPECPSHEKKLGAAPRQAGAGPTSPAARPPGG